MYISCPRCSTKFELNNQAIDKTIKLKCSQCQHIWQHRYNIESHAQNSSHKTEQQDHNDTKKPVHLPVIVPVNQPINSSGFSFTLLGLIVVMLVLLISGTNYEKLLFQKKFLQLSEVSVSNISDGHMTAFYQIRNPSPYHIAIGRISVAMIDKNHQIIKESVENFPSLTIPPFQHVNVTTEFSKINYEYAEKIESIRVDLQ